MKKLIAVAALLLAALLISDAQTVVVGNEASKFREYTYANLPSAAAAGEGTRVTLTDASSTACSAGSGTVRCDLRSTGLAWEILAAVGGVGGVGSAADKEVMWNNAGSADGVALASGQVLCGNGSGTPVACDPGMTPRTDSDGTVVLASTDRGGLVLSGHASANAVSIAQAGTTGFETGYTVKHCVTSTGVSTITLATSTINGSTTLLLSEGDCAQITSDGTNYTASVARASGSIVYQHTSADGGALEDGDDVTYLWPNVFGHPITIREICGRTDTGTSTFNLQRNDGSAASIATSNITATTSNVCTSTLEAAEVKIASGEAIDFLMVTGAASGSPTRIVVTIKFVRHK